MPRPAWLLPDESLEVWPAGPLPGGFVGWVVRREPDRPFGVLVRGERVFAGPSALAALRTIHPDGDAGLLADLCCHLIDPTGAGLLAWRLGDDSPITTPGVLPHPPHIVGDRLVYWRWADDRSDLVLVSVDLHANLVDDLETRAQILAKARAR